ncbi:hypothetical protein [Methylobacterium indicum]|uniref:Uncharacterized protein n=2 Tax=Methylobacterium indicum TaxID=1775910 RepID=A0A8H8WWZ6_9HYPH|nr:hypothetical protein [Methylobacterium indicum]BCM85734.1 hypothetical protein mvi_41950 [Methylobacterium indicum]
MPESPIAPIPAPSAEAVRVARQLGRLEALETRHRLRRRVARAVRGGLGGGGAFLVLVKAKLVGSLAGKLVIAAIVAIGFAWPLAALVAVVIAMAIAALFDGGPLDLAGCDCPGPNARRARLRALIAERRTWLAAPDGPAPLIRSSRKLTRA